MKTPASSWAAFRTAAWRKWRGPVIRFRGTTRGALWKRWTASSGRYRSRRDRISGGGVKMERRVSINDLKAMKKRGEKIVMLTAYDYPSARLVEEAGVPLILVGDSLGMVMLGYDSTIPVTMDEMLHHVRAVVRGTHRAHVVADMPF